MYRNTILSFNKRNVYTSRSPKGYGMAYFARKEFKKGDIIMIGFGKVIDHQTAHISVQIGFKKHYIPEKWTGRYWNHSCNPNSCIKTRSSGFPNLIALKKIKKNDEIIFLYAMSEFEWAKNTH